MRSPRALSGRTRPEDLRFRKGKPGLRGRSLGWWQGLGVVTSGRKQGRGSREPGAEEEGRGPSAFQLLPGPAPERLLGFRRQMRGWRVASPPVPRCQSHCCAGGIRVSREDPGGLAVASAHTGLLVQRDSGSGRSGSLPATGACGPWSWAKPRPLGLPPPAPCCAPLQPNLLPLPGPCSPWVSAPVWAWGPLCLHQL